MSSPTRTINATAPTRICDNGGWTDTWFAEYGAIFNIAVKPNAQVQLKVYPNDGSRPQVLLHAENYGDRYAVDLNRDGWDRHPLLEAAIKMVELPSDVAIEATIYSDAPAGASTGTSAAVTVALLGALDVLTDGRMSAHEVAHAAQRVETEMLGQQCGIQDQLAAAYGGINLIDMFSYPRASVSQLALAPALENELEQRLALIYLGRPHSSSAVHEMVIRGLEDAGPDNEKINPLRATARQSWNALASGDWQGFGRAMSDNTALQQALHPELVSADAHRVIEIAKQHGVLGWKVNGAGGSGGSVTLLTGADQSTKRAMLRAIEADNELYQSLPIALSRSGLVVWDS
ncbi:MAG: GHMP kinase [Candidatus Promineifilaceae bacterium]